MLEQMGLRPKQTESEEDVLFDGAGEMFMRLARGVAHYGEYGSGASTRWVAQHTDAQIVSVESDPAWAASVQEAIGSRGTVSHVQLGPVGKWGRPKTYQRRGQFATYQEWPWLGQDKPELVLIDGRFRVACFLVSLLEAAPGTPIVFDDYAPGFEGDVRAVREHIAAHPDRYGRPFQQKNTLVLPRIA